MKAPLAGARTQRTPREKVPWNEPEPEGERVYSRKRFGNAQSASPRPQRFRAVDAVKLAKHELESQTGPLVKAGRLRLSQFSTLEECNTGDFGPVIHEGFYKLTAAVTRPAPSLRQKAAALQESFDSRLRKLREDRQGDRNGRHTGATAEAPVPVQSPHASKQLALEGPGSEQSTVGDTFITANEESQACDLVPGSELQLVSVPETADRERQTDTDDTATATMEAELAKQELALCVETLQSYACETSSESRERRVLLDAATSTASESLEKLMQIIERQAVEARTATEQRRKLEARIGELEDDAEGLRKMVQRGLREEAELQKEKEDKIAEVLEKQQSLLEAERKQEKLNLELQEALERIRRRDEAEQQAQENLRDGANSPMMAFSTFVLGPDQVPSGPATSLSSIGGDFVKDREAKRLERHQTNLSGASSTTRTSLLLATGSTGLHVPPASGQQSGRQTGRLDTVPSQNLSRSASPDVPTQGSSNHSDDKDSAATPPHMKRNSRRRSEEEDSTDSEAEADMPRASPLASSFPALVPYLDFQKADAEAEKIKVQTASQNHEHLEKHMVMLQEERQQHLERNQLLQHAVDATLERILVWVQAAYDSLHDFGPSSVQQDAEALAAIRDMLAWLAQRSCKAWVDPPDNLEQALASHEDRLRSALALAENQSSVPCCAARSEVEELRKALQHQMKRVEDLEKRLEALRSPESNHGRQVVSEAAITVSEPEVASGVVHESTELGAQQVVSPTSPSPRPSLPLEASDPGQEEDGAVEDPGEDQEDCATSAGQGLDAAVEAEQEAQRTRLFRCPFAQAIDLTAAKRTRLSVPNAGTAEDDDSKYFGRRHLRSFITEVYTAKRLEDRRRDKTQQPRRQLHAVMQEILRRQHGVKRLVHQRSWQLLESVAQHAFKDAAVGLFADFLDGTRDLDELSFYLYCSALLASSIPEESQANPPPKLPPGFVSRARSVRLADLLFSDMPKALSVVQEEINRLAPSFATAMSCNLSFEELSQSGSFYGSPGGIEADSLCRALLEGWRVCSLLLNKSAPPFLWQTAVLAFTQADVHCRGWLDPHEVQYAEMNPALAKTRRSADLPLGDQTSLGAFVFRAVHNLGSDAAPLQDANSALASAEPKASQKPPEVKANRCFQVCSAAFGSLERSLGVYLSWLLHSDEPRDRVMYQSVKSRIFGYRRADSLQDTWPMIHNLRCLLVLLLTHQFDTQLAREEVSPEHLAWELTALLQILRESWRTGASREIVESGPEFGPELEEVGETYRDQKGPVTFSDAK